MQVYHILSMRDFPLCCKGVYLLQVVKQRGPDKIQSSNAHDGHTHNFMRMPKQARMGVFVCPKASDSLCVFIILHMVSE